MEFRDGGRQEARWKARRRRGNEYVPMGFSNGFRSSEYASPGADAKLS